MNPVPGGHDRLQRGADIAAVLRGRRQRAGRLVVAHVRSSATGADHGRARVAPIASRRVGDAVRRNRAKRLLREAARHTAIRPGMDVVLVARAETPLASMQQVQRELEGLLERLDAVPDTAVVTTR